jgi:hypothetical protein
MKKLLATVACAVVATGIVATMAYGLKAPSAVATPSLAPFEFHREAAASPEAAARALFRGISDESPKYFVQHLLLGVCDGSIDTLQKFAESLHKTEFTHDGDSFSFYDLRDLRKGIDREKPIRVVAYALFDIEDEQVAALKFQGLSTYYGEQFASVDVAAEGYDGREYQTRIVVAQVGDGWYAMPRCRSAQRFYEIADAMRLAPTEVQEAK